MASGAATADEASRHGLVGQLTGLDNRFWIVNTMEMIERLAYYGVRAVVALYMVLPYEQGGPQFTHVEKGAIFAAWASVQSVLPVFTGGFADRYGHKRTITIAILLKTVGYVLMATQMSFWGFWAGCMLLAAGTAVFKPGVQGTLAATLKRSNASVGWAIFYQLVNIGGFLGPVLAGVIRNEFSWAWVFYSCAAVVLVNFLWIPFYTDPTEEGDAGGEPAQAAAFGLLSRAVSKRTATVWTVLWGAALLYAIKHFVGVMGTGDKVSWMYVFWAALFLYALAMYVPRKEHYDAGHADGHSVFIVSVVGLFQHRVVWFCMLFAGFWLMFNQVFDLLPNVIDDWVDTSGVIATLGSAFSTPLVPNLLAVFLGVVFGGICAAVTLLAMRPDHRPASDVPWNAYAVVALAFGAAWVFPLMYAASNAALAPYSALVVGLGAPAAALVWAGLAYGGRLKGERLALFAGVLGGGSAFLVLRIKLQASAAGLVEFAAGGGQINPEWMINLNPALIVFTMVGFGYLTSFVRPLTSILIGMAIATVGSYIAGTAEVGWSCLAGIAVFSVGEMLSSPKKMEFLATLAKKGQEGTFMGYANMPVAIGWILGSIGAGSWYEANGDKKNLAMKHLESAYGMDRTALEELPRTELVPTLMAKMDMGALEVQKFLYETYQPQKIWTYIALIGVASIVGMVLYSVVLSIVDKRAAADGVEA